MDRGYGNVRCEEEVCTGMEYGMYGVDTRVATVSLHNDQPFFLNLPPLLYIIVIMSCYGGVVSLRLFLAGASDKFMIQKK